MTDFAMPAREPDILFVDVPADFSAPESRWNLAYRTLIAPLREGGISASILHPRARNARAAMIEDVVASGAKVVGFTTYDTQLPPLLSLIRDLRRAGLRAHVTLGGLCASAIPERILRGESGVDSVVFGEGDASIVDLAAHVLQGRPNRAPSGVCLRDGSSIVRGPARALTDLDALSTPINDDFLRPNSAPLRLANGCVPVIASRGCYGRCTFCCVQKFYRASGGRIWRGRDARLVGEDIDAATRATGTARVTFVDENFIGPGAQGKRHALAIARELENRNERLAFNFGCRPNDVDRETITALQRAGLAAVSLGIESMSGETLELFDKKTSAEINRAAVLLLEELGVFVEVLFIFFHPRSTLAEVRENLEFVDFIRGCRFAYFNNAQPFSELVPFFGTDLTARFEREGLVRRDLGGYSVRYADERVGVIARQVLGVPVDLLTRLRFLVGPTSGLAAELERAEIHLKMVRIPELAADLCDRFASGADIRAVTRAFAAETRKIHAVAARIAAFASEG